MTTLTRLQDALLDLGLEDLIPLPEPLTTPEVREAVGGEPTSAQLADALVHLLRLGLISVWAGHWQGKPRRVNRRSAERLLGDLRHYSFGNEADGSERVYFANVENVA